MEKKYKNFPYYRIWMELFKKGRREAREFLQDNYKRVNDEFSFAHKFEKQREDIGGDKVIHKLTDE